VPSPSPAAACVGWPRAWPRSSDLPPKVSPGLRLVRPGDPSPLGSALADFLDRYPHPGTRHNHERNLTDLFTHAGTTDPRAVTEGAIIAWATRSGANNTIRSRLGLARTFFSWCHRTGVIDTDPSLDLRRLNASYPRTYGKVEGHYPARWLTHDEAFGSMVKATQDGTTAGLRDELIIRLGLAAMRAAEIAALRIENVRLSPSPEIRWMGKGRRPRTLVPGASLVAALRRWLDAWQTETGTVPEPDDYLLATLTSGGQWQGSRNRSVAWGTSISHRTVRRAVQDAGERAGLGHVAPHDLRRSAAGLLHQAKTKDGGHLFDLLDIQKVMGHADPATTQRSYLDPWTPRSSTGRHRSSTDGKSTTAGLCPRHEVRGCCVTGSAPGSVGRPLPANFRTKVAS